MFLLYAFAAQGCCTAAPLPRGVTAAGALSHLRLIRSSRAAAGRQPGADRGGARSRRRQVHAARAAGFGTFVRELARPRCVTRRRPLLPIPRPIAALAAPPFVACWSLLLLHYAALVRHPPSASRSTRGAAPAASHRHPRPYPPKAILAQGHTPILLCRAGLLRDKLGSSATSWAPPRRAGLLRDLLSKENTICLFPSIYARATSS
ncbi:hypothetical protein Scep_010191 [Stephania cephalantha]|uniref:Uncharacterized protein n=1 Tax=Stephania cephalantha TaxID=152367 RepID=A0AAP0JVL2_9MAGN